MECLKYLFPLPFVALFIVWPVPENVKVSYSVIPSIAVDTIRGQDPSWLRYQPVQNFMDMCVDFVIVMIHTENCY
jgi:hypothetical protein